jgi:DNA-binding transcriptional LysR family regulator
MPEVSTREDPVRDRRNRRQRGTIARRPSRRQIGPWHRVRVVVVIRPDLTTLRVFLTVCNLGNITRAAEHEHIAPSAVSKRIQDLEAELGDQLFYRHPRGVTPTPAGEVLARHIQRLFEQINEMAAELSQFAKGGRGQVRIHAHASAVAQYLPAEIASFLRLRPGVRVDLREETSPNVLQSTLDGLADIGIYAGNLAAPRGLRVLPYREDELVAFFPLDHPLSRLERIDFFDIRDADHISLETGSSLQVLLARAAADMGFALKTRIEVTTFEAAMAMVDAGLGVAILPAGIVRAFGFTLEARAVPLVNDWARRRLVVCVRENQRLTASAALMLRHLCPEDEACPAAMPPVPDR